MPVVLKLSSQRQLTLTKRLVEAMGTPSHFEAVLVNKELVLRPALKMTLAEAEAAYGKHGITRDVLQEALRIVAGREDTPGS
ncbi:hypothetical protein [Falsiroseomonas oryzae]|uniref:hypothetical protein n=1 Tax=Falsiroseomonas oryzae TaxID=2766473 RepID=UPI0022EA968F|nr:hypothetical protein [Roseomonas sp. MO-31]